MNINITLANYRCFSSDSPAVFTIGSGFSAFVGVNNSGKTSLLKFFYEFRGLFSRLSDKSALAESLRGKPIVFPVSVQSHSDVFNVANANDIRILISINVPEAVCELHDSFNIDLQTHFVASGIEVNIPRDKNTFTTRLMFDGASANGGTLQDLEYRQEGVLPVFIGHLHIALSSLESTFYIGAFRNALNVDAAGQNHFDMQIGKQFIERWRLQKSGELRSSNQKMIELTNDLAKIFAYDRLEINTLSNSQDLQFIVNGKSFKLTEMGSGIAQFIVVLGNVMVQRPAFILIDEPELNLHPALQLDFLSVLASYATVGVVFATHSIGLAREIGDRVYSLRYKNGGFVMGELGKTPLSEFLGALGFAAYRELGYEKLLLVEGVSEIRAIRELLYHYGRNTTCVIMHMGGNNLINKHTKPEMSDLSRLCDDITVLIDSERTAAGGSPAKGREEFEQLCKELGMKVHMLERHSLENYFPDHAIKAGVGQKHGQLGHFDRKASWSKTDNWQITKHMKPADLNGTDLGTFLASL